MGKMKPILFNTEMVRAILEGRKTVTRRVLKQPFEVHANGYITKPKGNERLCSYEPPYKVGDVLYVRETWALESESKNYVTGEKSTIFAYKADPFNRNGNWRPSIHMPKAAARIFLKVTDVRVERLRDMTVEDTVKEGINTDGIITNRGIIEYRAWHRWYELWDATIKKSELSIYGTDANPYVWVIEFERIEKPEEA